MRLLPLDRTRCSTNRYLAQTTWQLLLKNQDFPRSEVVSELCLFHWQSNPFDLRPERGKFQKDTNKTSDPIELCTCCMMILYNDEIFIATETIDDNLLMLAVSYHCNRSQEFKCKINKNWLHENGNWSTAKYNHQKRLDALQVCCQRSTAVGRCIRKLPSFLPFTTGVFSSLCCQNPIHEFFDVKASKVTVSIWYSACASTNTEVDNAATLAFSIKKKVLSLSWMQRKATSDCYVNVTPRMS